MPEDKNTKRQQDVDPAMRAALQMALVLPPDRETAERAIDHLRDLARSFLFRSG